MSSGLADRVESAVRPRIPAAVLPTMVRLRTKRALRNAVEVANAERHMRFLTGAQAPDTDVDSLVARYLHLMKWRGEMRWHPEMITRQRVVGAEHLRAARDRGAGVILSFMHHGFYDGLFGSLAQEGVACTAIATPTMFTGTMPLWMRQQLAVVSIGAAPLNAEIGTRGIVEALGQGKVLAIATDVPSRTAMRFLGREVNGSFGAARIAHQTGAPVVLVTAHPEEPDGRGVPRAYLRVAPALDPGTFSTPQDLLAAILRHHEAAVAAWPEGSDQPLKRWAYADPDYELSTRRES